MSSRRVLILAMVAAASIATGALGAPPAPQYTMVELSASPGTAPAALHGSRTRTTLRAVGTIINGTYGSGCALSVPVFWDVTGTTSSERPVQLPPPVPGKPARAWVSSPDGSSIGGDAYLADNPAANCATFNGPMVWTEVLGGLWQATRLPLPPGFNGGVVRGVSNGGQRASGHIYWPYATAAGTRYAAKGVVWTRSLDGSYTYEILPSMTCDDCDTVFMGGLSQDGMTVAAQMDTDGSGTATRPRPVIWGDTGESWSSQWLRCLGTANEGFARANGAAGTYYGFSAVAAGTTQRHAVIWDDTNPNSTPRDLGTLGGPNSTAIDQNSTRVTVGDADTQRSGARAVRWKAPDWGIVDLNTVASTNGWTLTSGQCVDDRGRIAGQMQKVVQRSTVNGSYALLPTGN